MSMHTKRFRGTMSSRSGTSATGVGAAVGVPAFDWAADPEADGLAPAVHAASRRMAAITPIAPLRGEVSMPGLQSWVEGNACDGVAEQYRKPAPRVEWRTGLRRPRRYTRAVTVTDETKDRPLAPRVPLARASTIPSRYYTDPDIYANEVERVIGRT